MRMAWRIPTVESGNRTRLFAALILVACHCGGLRSESDAGIDAESSQCTSNGQRICYGPGRCGGERCNCAASDYPPDNLTICAANPGSSVNQCPFCVDGKVCIQVYKSLTVPEWCTEFDLGLLMLKNGGGGRVRYADLGAFDGTPLPLPTTCKTLPVARLCGPACPLCDIDEICHGRSPLHPYGICVHNKTNFCSKSAPTKNCQAGEKCFVFTVDISSQSVADEAGNCLPGPVCDDLAINYPGGGGVCY